MSSFAPSTRDPRVDLKPPTPSTTPHPPQHRCDLQSDCGPRTRQVQVPNTRNSARTSTHL
jgi:hypothetical protein